jgi:hypothetical protein
MPLKRESLAFHIFKIMHRLSTKPVSGIWFGETNAWDLASFHCAEIHYVMPFQVTKIMFCAKCTSFHRLDCMALLFVNDSVDSEETIK